MLRRTDSHLLKSHRNRVATLFGRRSPNSKEQLNRKLHRLVGSFIGSLDTRSDENFEERICINFCKQNSTTTVNDENVENQRNIQKEYSKEQMLRDLFLWAVFMNMAEMAKVLLIHVQSRVCAALIASAIFKQYAKLADTIDLETTLCTQALYFETYAANCIEQCYEYNERTTCELLFRQVPLFGYVTCMQVIPMIVAYSKLIEH